MASKTLVQSLFGTVRALEKCKSQFVSVSAFRNASTYRAAVCREHGKPLVLEDVPRTTLGEEEVRLRVHAAAVNVKDVACCVTGTGHRYLFDGKEPFVPGFEACGEVLEVGSKVKKFKVGERVICLNHSTLGGFAEECVASLPDCWAIDQDILFDKGAALLESYATALLSFGHRHRLKGGDKEVIMVTAAAGGLGLAALDVAANVFKTKVIAICTTEERSSEVRDLGAWASLVYDHKHLVSKVKEVTEGHGVDVVYEAVGGQVFETALQCVKHEGTVIVAAFASGKVPRIAAHQLFPNAPTLTGVSLPHYRQKNPKLFRHMCNEAVELLTRKLISPRISHEFPLSQVNEAVAMFSDTTRTGKILVMPSMKEKEVVEEGKKEGEGDGQKSEKEKKPA